MRLLLLLLTQRWEYLSLISSRRKPEQRPRREPVLKRPASTRRWAAVRAACACCLRLMPAASREHPSSALGRVSSLDVGCRRDDLLPLVSKRPGEELSLRISAGSLSKVTAPTALSRLAEVISLVPVHQAEDVEVQIGLVLAGGNLQPVEQQLYPCYCTVVKPLWEPLEHAPAAAVQAN